MLRLGVFLLLMLVQAGCATQLAKAYPRRPFAFSADSRMLDVLAATLSGGTLSEDAEYLYLSALIGLARSAGEFDEADRALEALRERTPDTRLSRLAVLWWGDNALYSGKFAEAERRYRIGLEQVRFDQDVSRQETRLLDVPLRDWLNAQLGVALALQGQKRQAVLQYETASLNAEALVETMRRRGALLAWDIGDRSLERRLREKIVPRFRPRRQGSGRPLPVRRLETLEMKAPWEPGVHQRAGALGRPLSYLGFAISGFRSGTAKSPCGAAAAGYYYRSGSHSASVSQGRDAYAIDFSAPGATRTRWGEGSFGIQLRAAAEGVAGYTYYGTRTHRNALASGPLADNNMVVIYHIPPGPSRLDLVLGQVRPGRGRARGPRWRPFELRTSWDYQTSYHHLVGIESPCPRGVTRGPGCIPFPALVSAGQYLWQGTPLGYEDSSGRAWIDHLHFQVNATCRPGGVQCPPDYRHRGAGRSVPMHLEGRLLSLDDIGACIESTNQFQLSRDEDRDGLPDLLRDTDR